MCYLVCGFVDLANVLENAICLKGRESLDVYKRQGLIAKTTRTFINTFSKNEYGVDRQRELRKLLGTCQFASK